MVHLEYHKNVKKSTKIYGNLIKNFVFSKEKRKKYCDYYEKNEKK